MSSRSANGTLHLVLRLVEGSAIDQELDLMALRSVVTDASMLSSDRIVPARLQQRNLGRQPLESVDETMTQQTVEHRHAVYPLPTPRREMVLNAATAHAPAKILPPQPVQARKWVDDDTALVAVAILEACHVPFLHKHGADAKLFVQVSVGAHSHSGEQIGVAMKKMSATSINRGLRVQFDEQLMFSVPRAWLPQVHVRFSLYAHHSAQEDMECIGHSDMLATKDIIPDHRYIFKKTALCAFNSKSTRALIFENFCLLAPLSLQPRQLPRECKPGLMCTCLHPRRCQRANLPPKTQAGTVWSLCRGPNGRATAKSSRCTPSSRSSSRTTATLIQLYRVCQRHSLPPLSFPQPPL